MWWALPAGVTHLLTLGSVTVEVSAQNQPYKATVLITRTAQRERPQHSNVTELQAINMASLACSQRLTAQPSTSARCVQTVQLRPSISRRTVAVRAAKLPEGVTIPPRIPQSPESQFGFVKAAERLNSRAAMLGFFGILIVEAIANKGIFELAGLEVGKGLGFEF